MCPARTRKLQTRQEKPVSGLLSFLGTRLCQEREEAATTLFREDPPVYSFQMSMGCSDAEVREDEWRVPRLFKRIEQCVFPKGQRGVSQVLM